MPREVDVGEEIKTLIAAKKVVWKRFDDAQKQDKNAFEGHEFWQAFAALSDCISSIIAQENNNG